MISKPKAILVGRQSPSPQANNVSGFSKLFDSAFVLAAASAMLYFWGIANVSGDAVVLELPAGLLKRDIWNMVAYGAEGLMNAIIRLPLLFKEETSLRWEICAAMAATLVLTLTVAYLTRASKHRPMFLGCCIFVGLTMYIGLWSAQGMMNSVSNAFACIRDQECSSGNLKTLAFETSKDAIEERRGVIVGMGERHIMMITVTGLFVVPIDRCRFIETSHEHSSIK